MTQKNQANFPELENDPFNTPVLNTQELSPLWSTSEPKPRWHLLTEQEQKDRDTVVRKLESKLNILNKKKEKSLPNYTNQIIPDVSSHFDSDSDQDDIDNRQVDEDVEGLPLLWKNKFTDVDVINRKNENEYNKKSWLSLFTCCWQ